MRFALMLLLGGTLLMASGGHAEGGSDILPRTVNFLIFAAILYYLVAEPVKNFFKNRSASIAAQLEEVQVKLKQAKEEKQKAEAELAEAKKLAQEIAETTKKEVELLTQELKKQGEQELVTLERSFEENIELERRKRIRTIVKEVLEEMLEDNAIDIDKEKFVNLIVKKVA